MDDWDPEFVARLSTPRRVIRFDNLGIGESSGETPNTVRGMAEVVPVPIKNSIGAIIWAACKKIAIALKRRRETSCELHRQAVDLDRTTSEKRSQTMAFRPQATIGE
jgi:hypothetical protein